MYGVSRKANGITSIFRDILSPALPVSLLPGVRPKKSYEQVLLSAKPSTMFDIVFPSFFLVSPPIFESNIVKWQNKMARDINLPDSVPIQQSEELLMRNRYN